MSIPIDISNDENISRLIFTPFHYNQKENKLKPGAYKPRSNKDEISVIRFDYSSVDSIKEKGLSMHSDKKKFFGYTKVIAIDIRNCHNVLPLENSSFINIDGISEKYRIELFYSPSRTDNCHSHLLYFYNSEEDEVLPAQINLLIQELIDKSIFELL